MGWVLAGTDGAKPPVVEHVGLAPLHARCRALGQSFSLPKPQFPHWKTDHKGIW